MRTATFGRSGACRPGYLGGARSTADDHRSQRVGRSVADGAVHARRL